MKISVTRLLIYIMLAIFTIFYIIPMYIMVVTGMKSFAEVSLDTMWNLPFSLNFNSFNLAWLGSTKGGFRGLSGSFLNSVFLVIPATVISALLGSLNGYVLTKWRFYGSDLIFTMILFGMFIPYQSIIIPLVLTLQKLHVYGTIPGLILVHVIYGLPISTLIFRNYYITVPTEMVEASKIDGANFLGIYRWVIFPLSTPGFAVAMIWQFTSIWNDFLFGLIVTPNPASQPITVALNNLAGSYFVQWNVQIAGALLTVLPPILVYIFLGRFFLKGLLQGSLKG
ncbi:carbohydrate ABC transporter permease [bacterium]|nr:carbohydrate ABC transporter permease [Candidatus Atribacteria bacterium]MBU1291680.1 carbohydrate ABC transporter permease [bacterium]MBU1428494.1 carbohydrate ABC transporter permease [bacterium]MBU2440583.1 carbohydrate ABC transporter permease [bacterium]MBU4562553.1 carbohydrate ABC transporter permease [bacterium]